MNHARRGLNCFPLQTRPGGGRFGQLAHWDLYNRSNLVSAQTIISEGSKLLGLRLGGDQPQRSEGPH